MADTDWTNEELASLDRIPRYNVLDPASGGDAYSFGGDGYIDNQMRQANDVGIIGRATRRMALFVRGTADLVAADRVQTGKDVDTTGQARDKAMLWANALEDQEVEAGKFSAFHFLRKTIGQFNLAKGQAEAAAAAYDAFDDRYLGAKSGDPSLDNDGGALIVGALYFNTADNVMKVYNGSGWQLQLPAAADYLARAGGVMTGLITFVASQFATQAQAEAGADTAKLMTPLRVAQAISKLAPPPKFESALLHVREEQAAGNASVDSVSSGAWVKRTLNTIRTNEISAGVSSSQITLSAGTYYVDASCPGYRIADHKARLYNVTDASVIISGTTETLSGEMYSTGRTFVSGRFTLNGTKVIRLEHMAMNASSFGPPTSGALGPAVFSDLKIWKVG